MRHSDMTRYVNAPRLLRRPGAVGIMTSVFILLQLIPGDPAIAMAGEKASLEQIERIREELGLNRPLPVQYAYFLKSAFTLNLGDLAHASAGRRRTAAILRRHVRAECAALVIALSSASRSGSSRPPIAPRRLTTARCSSP